jgi:Flp pilus assembly protein TadD
MPLLLSPVSLSPRLSLSNSASPTSAIAAASARRWNDYGIGLLEQAQYGAAAEAFRQANRLDPKDANLLVNAAIAEMRTERFAPEREQLRKAEKLLENALKIAPTNLRARYFRALVLRGFGKLKEAADELAEIARTYPRDREVQRQFGQTLYTLGRFPEARTALEAIIGIDPTDAGAYQLLNPIYASEGRKTEASRALSLYFEWRDDPRAEGVASRFFTAHPEWADERIGAHTHTNNSSRRAILTGLLATPEK